MFQTEQRKLYRLLIFYSLDRFKARLPGQDLKKTILSKKTCYSLGKFGARKKISKISYFQEKFIAWTKLKNIAFKKIFLAWARLKKYMYF